VLFTAAPFREDGAFGSISEASAPRGLQDGVKVEADF
jgi:hypothetical protein